LPRRSKESAQSRERPALPELDAGELVERIWERDPTVWTGHEEAHWLGWLDEPLRMRERSEELARLVGRRSHERVVVCGMGGSSLAPLVIGQTFGVPLEVLDTTHPAAIRRLEVDGALFVVSSKSGTTVETRCQFDHLWERTGKKPEAFVVITDPGSPLEELAHERGVQMILGEPTIGGRYSALSVFGLVPAALAGVDVGKLLELAEAMHDACRVEDGNPGLALGLALGAGWEEGRDKVVLEDPVGFGLWVEQLLAESTGKDGKGLVPAVGEPLDGGDRQHVSVELADPYDIGAEFFRFELATAVAGAVMGLNPFDQPNVEEAKERTRAILSSGHVPAVGGTGTETADDLLGQAGPGDYIAVQAFIDPAREHELAPLLERARATGCVVTVGLGPRYLHSTGQLHKGGPPTGLFIQVVDEPGPDASIPKRKFGFRRLIEAEAAGDYAALVDRGRRIVRVKLEDL
jgi:transaldolase/glucose-6-phosphate isomerase